MYYYACVLYHNVKVICKETLLVMLVTNIPQPPTQDYALCNNIPSKNSVALAYYEAPVVLLIVQVNLSQPNYSPHVPQSFRIM